MRAFWACLSALVAQSSIHLLILDKWSPSGVGKFYWWIIPIIFLGLTYIFWRISVRKKIIRTWLIASGVLLGFYTALFQRTTYLMPDNKRVQIGFDLFGTSELTDEAIGIYEQRALGNSHFLHTEKLMELYGNVPGSEKRIWKPIVLKLSNGLICVLYFLTMGAWGMFLVHFFAWIFQGRIKKGLNKRGPAN